MFCNILTYSIQILNTKYPTTHQKSYLTCNCITHYSSELSTIFNNNNVSNNTLTVSLFYYAIHHSRQKLTDCTVFAEMLKADFLFFYLRL